jgi:hypothetical protein
MLKTVLTAAVLTGALAGTASSAVVLADDFDGYSATNVLNVAAGFFAPKWTTTPTLDYIVNNQFGNLCRGTGACVDLDGSSKNSGQLQSVANFAAGQYELTFELFGNSRGAAADTVTITLGSFVLVLSNIASGDDVSQTVSFTTTGGQLTFQNAGGDNIGAVLSSVSLAAVPLPAAGLLLLAGLGGLAALRRREGQPV